jgi:predicted nucleic-acid-binding Zn-ribbon protein
MKNTGKCPKCDSVKVVRTDGMDFQRISVGIFANVPVTRYVCSKCGFTEEWIESPVDMEKIRDYYG